MADVTKPKGFRARLGLASKTDSPRKLVRKSTGRDGGENVLDQDEFKRQASRAHSDASLPNGLTNECSESGRRSSLFSSYRSDEQRQGKVPSESKARRKLSKTPQSVPKSETLDKDTGERKDLTDMLHAFSYTDAAEPVVKSAEPAAFEYDISRPDGSALLSRLPVDIWALVADYLSPLDVAHLTMTSKTTYHRMIRILNPLLRDPLNRHDRQTFLLPMSPKLPGHLFCFPCTTWHVRTQPGRESLKPSSVLNPLFNCPNSTNNLFPPPRLRLAEGRTLPFIFVQLAKRHWSNGPTYGIPIDSLARRWKDSESPWRHETKYHIHTNGHFLIRIKSSVYVSPGMTPAAKRLLLFSRGDYTPYFSVCSHWRSGILTSIPKCALDHIPVPQVNALAQIRAQKVPGPVTLCSTCRPLRRCPDCPTEYLVEIKLVEDRTVRGGGVERFKLALEVSRWSDLGVGESPEDREWAAVTGGKVERGNEEVGEEHGTYDSFKEIGGRGISGVFEGAFSETVPGQRVESMRPGKGGGDVDDDGWY